jgi:hypothetical protein
VLIWMSIKRPFHPFHGANQQVLSLVEPAPQVETDFATEHNCAFWGQVG